MRQLLNIIVCVVIILALQLVLPSFWPVQARSQISISVDPFVTGLTQPVYLTNAGDGLDRLFIVEQPGTIRIVRNGAVLTTHDPSIIVGIP